jgi:hypothetical protein
MQFKVRKLQETDWDTLTNWWSNWKGWESSAPTKDSLPDNGTGGLIIETLDGEPIVAGFVYISNSKTTFLDWIISNPNYKKKDRREAIKHLISNIEDIVKQAGYKYIFSITRNSSLLAIHEELGYIIDKTKSNELIKIL